MAQSLDASGARAASRRRAFVALGSNLGDRARYLGARARHLSALPATALLAVSRIYETAPQEVADQPAFLNQVVCIETGLAPLDLLRACQAIERAGRRYVSGGLARARSISIYCSSKASSRTTPSSPCRTRA